MILGESVRRNLQDVISLVTRLSLSFVFLQSGWMKVMRHALTIDFFRHLGFGPMAPFLSFYIPCVELICGGLLLLGFLTRISSAILAFEMVVAIVTANRDSLASLGQLFRLYDFLYILLFTWLVTVGGGRYSIDNRLAE